MVFLQKCQTYEREQILQCMRAIFDAHGGVEAIASAGQTVAIKPNMVSKRNPDEAATTHPSLVWACAKILTEAGINVIIVESPGGLYEKALLKGLYRTCGMEEAARDSGATLNFDTSIEQTVNDERAVYLKTLEVLKPLLHVDAIINIAKLKTHGMMVYTGAVKNMFGAVAGVAKAEYHCKMPDYESFANTIIDIFLAVKPKLSIIDGIIGMHKDGPTAGEPIEIGALISSTDAFEADRVALDIIGAPPERVPLMRCAFRRGFVSENTADIKITGDTIENLKTNDFIVRYNDACERLYFKEGILGRTLVGLLRPKPVFSRTCRSCGECAKLCPVNAITVEKGSVAAVDLKKCIRCYCCQELCPFKAVNIKKNLIARIVLK